MSMGGQRYASAALAPGMTRYPLYRKVCGLQGRSGRVRKISPPTGIRSSDRPARSESLYRLSYRGPLLAQDTNNNVDINTILFFFLTTWNNAWIFQITSFPQVSPPKPCMHLSASPIRATYPAHLILLDLIYQIIFGEQYSSWNSSLCSSLQPPVTAQISSLVTYSRSPLNFFP
jgi:hypothetical protein